MGIIEIKGVKLGQGAPKVIVPLMGRTEQSIITEMATIKALNPDMIEWRTDVFEHVEQQEAVQKMLVKIRNVFKDIPLIFTFRSHKEGGQKEMSDQAYVDLLMTAIDSKIVDLVDIELLFDEKKVKCLINYAKENDVHTIVSNHEFNKTPTKDVLISRIQQMQILGADIPKIAVMPCAAADVLTLLDATNEMKINHGHIPIITIAMGKIGLISRLTGELFGSVATFAVGEKASAPGQIAVNDLRSVLELLHLGDK